MASQDSANDLDLGFLNLRFIDNESMASWQSDRVAELRATREQITSSLPAVAAHPVRTTWNVRPLNLDSQKQDEQRRLVHLVYSNEWRCAQHPLYGFDLRHCLHVTDRLSGPVSSLVLSNEQRALAVHDLLIRFTCIITPARAPPPVLHCSHPLPSQVESMARATYQLTQVILTRPVVETRA